MRFDVLPGDTMETFGMVTLRPKWSFAPAKAEIRPR
jgi:hypothetical protein